MIVSRRWFCAAGLAILVIFLSGGSYVPAGAASLPTIVPGSLPAEQVDAKGWSEPCKVDGRQVRVAKAGVDAVLTVKPWWTGRLRPAEGNYWMAVVQFKDTARQPIVFSVFGNLAGYWGRTELHRFGGFEDGQWRKAEVPLPWDMIMARPDTGMVNISLRSAEGDVPVASIKIRKLNTKDLTKAGERYNRQTREWIGRVQRVKYGEARNEIDPAEAGGRGRQKQGGDCCLCAVLPAADLSLQRTAGRGGGQAADGNDVP